MASPVHVAACAGVVGSAVPPQLAAAPVTETPRMTVSGAPASSCKYWSAESVVSSEYDVETSDPPQKVPDVTLVRTSRYGASRSTTRIFAAAVSSETHRRLLSLASPSVTREASQVAVASMSPSA